MSKKTMRWDVYRVNSEGQHRFQESYYHCPELLLFQEGFVIKCVENQTRKPLPEPSWIGR